MIYINMDFMEYFFCCSVPQKVDPPPENVTVSDVTTSSFKLKWDTATDSVSFEVKGIRQ